MAHGVRPPTRPRAMGGAGGGPGRSAGHPGPPARPRPQRPRRLRGGGPRDARDARRLRGRRQRVPRDHARLARRVPAPRRPSPEPWAPWDSLAVFKIRHVEMGPWRMKIWRARLVRQLGPRLAAYLCPGTPPTPMLIVPPGVEYRGPEPDALETLERSDAALASLPALDRREQQLGPGGIADGLGPPARRGRPPSRPRHPELLLPEPSRLPRVRRHRAFVPRRPRPLPLRPQPPRGLVRHARDGGLPGRLRRALRPRRPHALRVPGRVAAGRRPARDRERPRGSAGRRRDHRDASRAGRPGRSRERARRWRSATRRRPR